MTIHASKYGLYVFAGCILIGLLFLSGCGADSRQQALQKYIVELKRSALTKKMKVKVTTWQLPTPVIYNPNGYTGSNTDAANAKKNNSNPLQSYPVKSLQFVGILTQDKQVSAYLMTPDGMIYLVKVGDVIGEEYGKIVKIDLDHIEIALTREKRIVTMELKDTP